VSKEIEEDAEDKADEKEEKVIFVIERLKCNSLL
jgi:hypothetical protein